MEGDAIVPVDPSRLETIDGGGKSVEPSHVVSSLREDRVVLVRGLGAQQADALMHSIAESVGLADSLELQAAFADINGHRQAVGDYFMTVNARDDYQFIPPHSEGSALTGMQLASFYCHENSTDGGDTILLKVDHSSDAWSSLREVVTRGKLSRSLAQHELVQARGMYQVDLPRALLKDGEQVVQERPTEIPGLTLVDVLAPLEKVHSILLDRDVYAYWDNVASTDFDAPAQYERLLRACGMLKEPAGGLDLRRLDNAADRRVYSSKVAFEKLFVCRITHKLAPGDFVVLNNLSWAHSVSNWTPGSGTRRVSAAFA